MAPTSIVLDVGPAAADVETLDALARLQLAARRAGLELRLRHASPELTDLIAFAGLDAVLRVEVRRQTEEREERLGLEEEGQLPDPPVA
jgi:hypothetical protein